MEDIVRWTIAVLLAGVCVAINWANIQIARLQVRAKEGESKPSFIVFAGGIVGAIALIVAPHKPLNDYFWVALLVDLGTGPFVLVMLFAAILGWVKQDAPKPPPPGKLEPKERAIVGCILGTAVGDAMGLACEGLSRRRQRKLFPQLTGYKLLPFGKGMCSDDTEHTCMLAQSLIETAGWSDADEMARKFASNFGWRLRFWLLGLPAGIGLATLRAILKLWIGFPARYSGVFSAGNGPAMRVALLGVCFGDEPPRMRALVRAATRITHTDPKAEYGALAVALAAHFATTRAESVAPSEYLSALQPLCGENAEFMALMRAVAQSAARGESTENFAATLGCELGVTGYMYHSVPVALHVWLRRPADYRAAVTETVRLGGDSDTVAAVVGALVGARVGKDGIPAEWLRGLWEWPRTKKWLEQLGVLLAERCNDHANGGALPLNWLKLMLRNALFIPLVLAHGFRRLLPPY